MNVRWVGWTAALLALASLVLACVLLFPGWIVAWDLGKLAPPSTPTEVLKARNDIRATLLQAISALLFIITAYSAWRQHRLSQVGQSTERFHKAIDQLGHNTVQVRLGGIYALERLIRDSTEDWEQIAEVLVNFVHKRAPRGSSPPAEVESLIARAPDVQAAMSVLKQGRIRARRSLASLHFGSVDLRRGNFVGAYLDNAGLSQALLDEANLHKARLREGDLNNAQCCKARFEGALLRRIKARGAILRHANMKGADLRQADLAGADLRHADLRGARFDKDTDLTGADLCGANLEKTKVAKARLGEARASKATRWPAGFDPSTVGVKVISDS